MKDIPNQQNVRCLVAKVGSDEQDREAHVIARALRDAGFEVIYSGLHKAPEEIVHAVVQEDVDVLGISILSDGHNELVSEISKGLKEYDVFEDTLMIIGGAISEETREFLSNEGVEGIFGPKMPINQIIEFIEDSVKR